MLGKKERAAGTAPKELHQTQIYNHPIRLSRAKWAIELAAQFLLDLQKPQSSETNSLYARLIEGHLRRYACLKAKKVQ